MHKTKISFIAACLFSCMFSCKQSDRNTEPLVDPWTRERTPVDFRLQSQIGAPLITSDWRHDDQGSIKVTLMTSALDLSAVKVEALDFEFPESEFCPTASIKAGDVIDLSKGTCSFVVTAYNGETRTYTISYDGFTEPLEGQYAHDPIAGILDAANAPKSSMVIYGGWTGGTVISTAMDKSWHWGAGYTPADEEDNILSFKLTSADSQTGTTFGTLVNTPGADGKYANYMYANEDDVNAKYRIFPEGSSRWSKDRSGNITIYAADDGKYEHPLYVVTPMPAGVYPYTRDLVVANYAFGRDHNLQASEEVNDGDWNNDKRWMVNNIRHTIWLVKKTSDSPLDNHTTLFE